MATIEVDDEVLNSPEFQAVLNRLQSKPQTTAESPTPETSVGNNQRAGGIMGTPFGTRTVSGTEGKWHQRADGSWSSDPNDPALSGSLGAAKAGLANAVAQTSWDRNRDTANLQEIRPERTANIPLNESGRVQFRANRDLMFPGSYARGQAEILKGKNDATRARIEAENIRREEAKQNWERTKAANEGQESPALRAKQGAGYVSAVMPGGERRAVTIQPGGQGANYWSNQDGSAAMFPDLTTQRESSAGRVVRGYDNMSPEDRGRVGVMNPTLPEAKNQLADVVAQQTGRGPSLGTEEFARAYGAPPGGGESEITRQLRQRRMLDEIAAKYGA